MTYNRFVLRPPILFALLTFLSIPATLAFQAAPNVDDLKRTLNKRLMDLKPEGYTERNVLFQQVIAGRPSGASYPFRVTALIRDYGPGYPKNQYYGQTCVSKMNQRDFLMVPDAFGGWQVQGAMTVTASPDYTCKNNPAENASSFPLATLEGTAAPTASTPSTTPANTPKPAVATGVAQGSYECWSGSSARMSMNFKITGPGKYTDSEGKPGAYRLDPSNGRITFQGAGLDGVLPANFYMIYYAPNNHPTVSFRNGGGTEVSFCEKAN
jgi:hypothetical protein